MKSAEKIRLLREMKNWSQEEMADKLNLSLSGYAKIERGETRLNMPRLEQIADIFGANLLDLLPSSDSNFICLISEGENNQGSNYYANSQEVMAENERLRLMVSHKEELLAQQAREIAVLNELLAMYRQREQTAVDDNEFEI
ncbi:transcriptional regulator with XRE-family HTH domain [Neisseria sp. HSC-16F19]|nr:helix-turn-helix transcriptional regulator [Neisseria sp. HSC-16F19]MCP2040385.1 transcriptional regulator with XRE-family HTH domain [Neisseria sp. HSC-16F19]